MMKYLFLFAFWSLAFNAFAQPDDPKTLQETARGFMRSGDYDNAIIVLTRALQKDPKSLELQKDLVLTYYLKRDFEKALPGVKALVDREDIDVMTYQICGNVYKALEEVKECDKMYRKALKQFPKSGPLYSEYGELLWAQKDFSAIKQWELGIELDPSYSGNYYNAAMFYFYAKDKVWSLIYGEIFVNMESRSERGLAMKEQLLSFYKEKLFAEPDLMKGEEKNPSAFAKGFLQIMNQQSGLVSQGVTVEVLTQIRTRFILSWFEQYAGRFPFRLFDYQRQLLTEGLFEAYNQWLFGPSANLAAYENWTRTHAEEYKRFKEFSEGRIFKVPYGQYYKNR